MFLRSKFLSVKENYLCLCHNKIKSVISLFNQKYHNILLLLL
jgi:hypothetical protein